MRPSKGITPYRWEQGTLPFELLAAVEEAVEYIADLSPVMGTRRERLVDGFARIKAYEFTQALRLEARAPSRVSLYMAYRHTGGVSQHLR